MENIEFVMLPEQQGEKYILCFEGLDYHGEVYLNGVLFGKFCGIFVPLCAGRVVKIRRRGYQEKGTSQLWFYNLDG